MNPLATRRPTPQDHDSPYIGGLIAAVEGNDVLQVLESQLPWLGRVSEQIGDDQAEVVHPPYGWSIRQVFEHLTDADRVFGYRMLRLAAGDETPLPGWDENAYANAGFQPATRLAGLIDELRLLREANLSLLRRIPPGGWDRSAVVSGSRITVRGVAWLMAGHFQHHLRIVTQRLGIEA